MKLNRPFCLSIAGFDPSAGAGILADIKTFEMLDVYGLGVITSNTIQTDRIFIDAEWIDFEKMKYQIRSLFDTYLVHFAKIGLIKDFDILKNVILFLKEKNENIQIVWDPVLKSSAGFRFHEKGDLDIGFLENECTLITPNWNEFETLWGISPERLISRTPSSAILIKGGHRKDKPGTDLLFLEGKFSEIPGESFGGRSKHGTGCVFSAAVTAFLAKGSDMISACKNAKNYTEKFILSNAINLGYHHGV